GFARGSVSWQQRLEEVGCPVEQTLERRRGRCGGRTGGAREVVPYVRVDKHAPIGIDVDGPNRRSTVNGEPCRVALTVPSDALRRAIFEQDVDIDGEGEGALARDDHVAVVGGGGGAAIAHDLALAVAIEQALRL